MNGIKAIIYNVLLILVLLCPTDMQADEAPKVSKGVAYLTAQRYAEAIDCFVEDMEKARKDGDTPAYYSSMANIGSIYGFIGNYKRSLYYLRQAYDGAVRSKNKELQAEMTINLIGTYVQMGDVENAKKFFAIQNRVPVKDVKLRHYYFLYNQAMIAKLEKHYSIAEYYHHQAFDYAMKSMKNPHLAITQYIELGDEKLSEDSTAAARACINKAIAMAKEAHDMIKLHDSYGIMVKVCQHEGNKAGEQKFNSEYLALSDSLFNRQQIEIANNKVFDYEKRASDEEIDTLNNRINLQTIAIIVGIVIVVMLAVFLFIIQRNMKRLRKAQRLLINRNSELMKSEERSRRLLEERYPSPKDPHDHNAHAKDSDDEKSRVTLSAEQQERLLAKINNVMKDVGIISQSDFSLNKLAELVGSNTKYVSLVIRDTYGKNFKSFLNEYRIREACRRLTDTEHYGNVTIQAIYQDLGYNSPSGFIEAFKKVNGMTPSVYQRLSRQSE